MTIEISNTLGRNSPADEYDVRRVKTALNRLGYYMPYNKTGITGIPDTALFDGISRFQADHKLPRTGELKPGDETVNALNTANAEKKSGQYIWHTVGDNKVRGSRAALNGTIRDFSDSPDPGEDFNCRCWAELLSISDGCEKEKERYKKLQTQVKSLSEKLKK